jgi:hypothetical protein
MSYKDIITDENGDIEFLNGDLKVNESDAQHVDHIITTDKGQFRQFPLLGVGIGRLLNGTPNQIEVQQQIRLNLESDGYNVRQITIDNTKGFDIDIDAERKNV